MRSPSEVEEGTTRRLKQCLEANGAMDLNAILKHIGTGRDYAVKALSHLVSMNEVEVLRPVAVQARGAISLHPLEHYRLIRPTDMDYRWEADIQENQEAVSPKDLRLWALFEEPLTEIPWSGWRWPACELAYSV